MQKLSLKSTLSTALLLAVIVQSGKAEAHRSGCHRWHSCPSDTGSYVCGDLGYTSQCPTPTQPSTSNPNTESTYNQYMQIGYNAVQKKDYQNALINFKKALDERPGDSNAIKAIRNLESKIQRNVQHRRQRAERRDD